MIRILIVDDQNFTRQALRAILQTEANLIIAGEAENGIKALELMEQSAIDLAIVDLDMPGMDGFELTKTIRKNFSKTQVIILSSHDDRFSINKAVNFGAKGYLLKDTSIREVLDTIDRVQRGYFQLGPGLFEKFISESISHDVKTSENLSKLETKSNQDFAQLQEEILVHKKQVHQELMDELNLEISNLKIEFRQGLNIFQTQVANKLERGFRDFANANPSFESNPEFSHQRYYKIIENIQSIENFYKLSLDKLKKEVTILRYGLIFLLIVFLIEKTAIVFF